MRGCRHIRIAGVIGTAEPFGAFARPAITPPDTGAHRHAMPRAAFAVPSRMHGRRCTRQRVLSDLPPSTRCAQAAVPHSHVPGAKVSVRSLARDEVSGGPSVRRCRCCRTQVHRTALAGFSHSASLAGQAMNRYRGTHAEFQFSIVAPQTAHSKLLISRASAMCSLRS